MSILNDEIKGYEMKIDGKKKRRKRNKERKSVVCVCVCMCVYVFYEVLLTEIFQNFQIFSITIFFSYIHLLTLKNSGGKNANHQTVERREEWIILVIASLVEVTGKRCRCRKDQGFIQKWWIQWDNIISWWRIQKLWLHWPVMQTQLPKVSRHNLRCRIAF